MGATEVDINVDEVIERVVGDIDGVWWLYIGCRVMNDGSAGGSAAVVMYHMLNLAVVIWNDVCVYAVRCCADVECVGLKLCAAESVCITLCRGEFFSYLDLWGGGLFAD